MVGSFWVGLPRQPVFFSVETIWFPIPRLQTSYAQRHDVAISQMSPAAIRYMVVAMVLGAEVAVDVEVEFLRQFLK